MEGVGAEFPQREPSSLKFSDKRTLGRAGGTSVVLLAEPAVRIVPGLPAPRRDVDDELVRVLARSGCNKRPSSSVMC